jgi:hypothetical protein
LIFWMESPRRRIAPITNNPPINRMTKKVKDRKIHSIKICHWRMTMNNRKLIRMKIKPLIRSMSKCSIIWIDPHKISIKTKAMMNKQANKYNNRQLSKKSKLLKRMNLNCQKTADYLGEMAK